MNHDVPPPPSPQTPSTFRALFDEHAAFVWRVLLRHGVPERDLEDGCQEVFLIVHRRLGEFEGRSSLRTWMYGIATRVALGMRRKVHVTREQLGEELPDAGCAAPQVDELEQRQRLALVEAALSSLHEDKREVFALYELEGMTMAEVAAALEVPENTALYRLYGARDEIQAFIKRRSLVGSSRRPVSTGGKP